MARPLSLQVYVSRELAERVRTAAAHNDLSISEWVRTLVASACDQSENAGQHDKVIERIHRQSVFIMVGLDALLAGHPDHGLRDRAHQAYGRKCKQLGITSTTSEGAST
jgi:hypothetical protein